MMKMMRPAAVSVVLLFVLGSGPLQAGEKWQGVDDAVVNKIAREHGHPERPALIPAAAGDLQLFMFLLAGTMGGFVAGYYWRVLMEGAQKRSREKP
ncbi:MAG: cobalt transporter [Geobacteraceae bacterium]|nr:cobalt transporter [Geobacteraceae bacterium]